jgi:hypothetical protein
MTWWSGTNDTGLPRQPFTVILSVGLPKPKVGGPEENPEEPFPEERAHDELPITGRHWLWQQSVSALLHAVFVRGGSVAARLDDELLPFLWGTAQVHAQPVPAEHGEMPSEPPVYVLATDRDERRQDADSEADSPSGAFEVTGLVRVHRVGPDFSEIPGPRPHFGVVLWPDRATEADLRFLSSVEGFTVVRWWDEPSPAMRNLRAAELIVEGSAPPLHYLLERLVDSWLEGGPDRASMR